MSNICVIGPRSSGKTTYLAALAFWAEQKRLQGKGGSFSIQPLSEDARELAEKAENLILEGASLEPTQIGEQIKTVDDLPYFSFKLEVKRLIRKPAEIFLAVRDYPGEIFDELEHGLTNPLHEEFINECLMKDIKGCLLLVSDWGVESDKFYSRVMRQFTDLMDSHNRSSDLKIAVAMSKCERGEIWSGRLDPETDLFDVHLPKTKATLRSRIASKNLQFFAISTFGVLRRNDPRPNRVDVYGTGGRRSTLRKPSNWNPFGMIQPLYWLSS